MTILPRQRRRASSAPKRLLSLLAVTAAGTALAVAVPSAANAAAPSDLPTPPVVAGAPNLGPNVYIFTPDMAQADIQSTVDAVAAAQNTDQFGTQRVSLLFEPGTYGSQADPLNFQVGYYTEVAGLGQNPNDVVVNGSIDVFNQCGATGCIALNNFWRSMSNLTINVAGTGGDQYSGCYSGEFWAVSQAAPMRRVNIASNGHNITLMDYCTGPSYASGGFIADSNLNGSVINGSQQQFLTRNSSIGSWSNGVWNAVFSGVNGAPAEGFPTSSTNYYTTNATTRASKEKPYLYVDGSGAWRVFVPSAQQNSSGTTWSATTNTAGTSFPLSKFYVAKPGVSAATINAKLAAGKYLLLTPGAYRLGQAIRVTKANTVVLGMGLATITPTAGNLGMTIGDVTGVDVAGIVFEAGATNSPTLLQVGATAHGAGSAAAPTALQDVFFRIGGAQEGKATVSLKVNSDDVILDDIWAWRADHGTGVGWTANTAATGLLVNGDDVTATGLFVEHYQKTEVQWNGDGGSVTFFQNEMPYDVPSQAAWGANGYVALKVAPSVTSFQGYGMGSYSFFNQGVDIHAANAFSVPNTPGVHLHDLLTIFLDASAGSGGIDNVVNGVGGSSTAANASTPVTVTDYPATA